MVTRCRRNRVKLYIDEEGGDVKGVMIDRDKEPREKPRGKACGEQQDFIA
jgi:hypothetical protein